MSREDDGRLADRLIAGDPSAFHDLVKTYQRKVYGLAYEMTRNHADAEDIAQVTFLKIHKSMGMIRPGSRLNAWIYQIAYHTALDEIRQKSSPSRQAASSFGGAGSANEPPDPSAGPDKAVEAACLRRRIDEALAKISSRERAAFILRHYHDLKLKEIAETLGVSLGAAKSYLFRALQKLQKELAPAEICRNDGDRS